MHIRGTCLPGPSASTYNTVRDVIFHLAIESEGQFRYISANAAFFEITGLKPEMVIGRTTSEVIPDPRWRGFWGNIGR
jgi:PAS domain S-box-containing protein